jgi:uncharacterized protein YebE (UPF0316 family)
MESLFSLPYGPVLIFAMRVVDVSLGTLRTMITVRGERGLAALMGFVEVLVWILAAGSALQHLDSAFHLVAYAGGFAAGNYVGIVVENAIALGTVVVRAIIPDEADGTTARRLRDRGYAVTEIDGRGREGAVDILNTVVPRKEAARVIEAIEAHAPRSFVTVEELRTTHRGALRPTDRRPGRLVRR